MDDWNSDRFRSVLVEISSSGMVSRLISGMVSGVIPDPISGQIPISGVVSIKVAHATTVITVITMRPLLRSKLETALQNIFDNIILPTNISHLNRSQKFQIRHALL
jgi:hypothetical protein